MNGFEVKGPGIYRRRDGKKCHVIGRRPDEVPGLGYWIGFIEGETVACAARWEKDGSNGNSTSDCDLVAEWVEPKRLKGWMNVYDGQDPKRPDNTQNLKCDGFGGSIFATRSDADIAAKENGKAQGLSRVACIEIDVLEGQGLEGGQ